MIKAAIKTDHSKKALVFIFFKLLVLFTCIEPD